MKRDIGLLLIGTCFGVFLCSVGAFLLAYSYKPEAPKAMATVAYTSTNQKTKTSTAIPYTSTITNTPTITSTPTITYTPSKTPTITKTPDIRSLYAQIPNKELYTYADNHVGEKVKVRGTVFNINNTKELQIFAGGSSNYPMYLVFSSRFSGIYEDDVITVYATVGGTNCGTNAFGGEICQPLLLVDFYEK